MKKCSVVSLLLILAMLLSLTGCARRIIKTEQAGSLGESSDNQNANQSSQNPDSTNNSSNNSGTNTTGSTGDANTGSNTDGNKNQNPNTPVPNNEDDTNVKISASTVRFFGRTYTKDDVHYFNWTASGFEMTINGTGATFEFESNGSQDDNYARLDVYVDNAKKTTVTLSGDSTSYSLPKLKNGNHTIKVIKKTNARSSTAGLRSITLDKGTTVTAPPAAKTRRIEFIGDSITVGYGVDDPDPAGTYTTRYEDGTKTYAALAAQHFSADYNVTAISGRGIVRNTGGDKDKLLPDIYEYLDIYNNPSAMWDFNTFQPDVVVVNLGTNDASGNNTSLSSSEFKSGCKKFLQKVRSKNPKAQIIYAYGFMSEKYYSEISACVSELKSAGDSKISMLKLALISASEKAEGHPNVAAHLSRSKTLISKISEVTGWK